MSIGYDHEVTAVVGIQIHDNKTFFPLPHDESARIVSRALHTTEDTFS
jgi:hypothetical protein